MIIKQQSIFAQNPVQHDTKHIEVDRHFIKEKLDSKVICIPFVKSNDQLADFLTKGVAGSEFRYFLSKPGMISMYQLKGQCRNIINFHI